MKILWFSNAVFSENAPKATGTWLYTMADALTSRGVELYNITQSGRSDKIIAETARSVKQWVLPIYELNNGIPSMQHIQEIQEIVENIKPDMIHVWGIESYWGLLTARGFIQGKVLLEIQGIRETCARVFYGGLSIWEVLSTLKTKEFIKPSISLPLQKRKFSRWSSYEREIIGAHDHISTHSDWVRAWVMQFIKTGATIHYTHRIVRSQFYNSQPWCKSKHDESAPVLITLSSEAHAFKGLHDGIKALAILKRKYPHAQLRIAGNFEIDRPDYKKNGYTKYLLKLIKKHGLSNNVVFLGSLDAESLSQEMHHADVMLQTSYVESYSLALSEALAVGMPCVVSYAGAMPELARDGIEALFYTPSDYFKLAFLIDKIIDDTHLSASLSEKARLISQKRNNPDAIVENQFNIYNMILSS